MMMLDEKLRDKQMLAIYPKKDMNEYIYISWHFIR